MTYRKPTISSLLLASFIAILLSACGDGTGGVNRDPVRFDIDSTPNITIGGTVTAPGGAVTLLEKQSYMNFAMNMFISPVYADILGLQPVGGATVELIRIDDDGVQVGDVLASTTTSITGDYSLELPAGVELSADLIVRITGTGISMSAMVVDQAIDINPISQFVLQKFIDDDTLVLADLPINQVIALKGRVEEFDLTTEADLTAMLAKLEEDLGDLAEADIAEIQRTPADDTVRTAALGTWNLIEFSIGLHDNEEETFGTTAVEVFSSSLLIEAGTEAGTLTITENDVLIDSFTNLFVDNSAGFINSSIFNEFATGGDEEEFGATVDADGNLSVSSPFEEDFTTDNSQQGTGPDFGFRFPPATISLDNTGNDNVLISSRRDAGVRFDTVDTNEDGIRDAVDPESKDGDEASVLLNLVLKGGTEMSVASLDGYYGAVSFFTELASFGSSSSVQISSTVIKVDFDGAGEASVPVGGLDEVGFSRTPTTLTNVMLNPFEDSDGDFGLPYSVSANGGVTLVTGETEDMEGWTNDDGSLFALLDVQTFEEIPNEICCVFNELMLGVKLPTTMPNLSGASYRLHGIAAGADETGTFEVFTFGPDSTLTFDASAASATSNVSLRGFERDTDVASVNSFSGDDAASDSQLFEFFSPIDAMGKIEMTSQDSTSVTHLTGFVSADAKVIIFRLESIEEGDSVFRDIGLIIAVLQ
ncbi:MAG: hypothetical protein ACI9XC_000864 [Gammaproteobacteria bacterium]|jgi:hypothetical protein